MKKVLLATTALVAFAGAAAAEISLSGDAEMGIVGGGVNATNGSNGEAQFWQTFDITFTGSGESDSGLSFGASVDLSEAPAVEDSTNDNGYSVFLSGAFGTLTLGNTDGALDWALTEAGNMGNPGTIDDAETSHAGYNGDYLDGEGDGQVLRYDYAFGDVGFAVSVEQDYDGAAGAGNENWAVGVKYGLDLGGTTVNLGAGYQQSDVFNAARFGGPIVGETEVWGISATASLGGGFTGGIVYSDWDVDGVDATHTGVGLGYETGPIALHANYGVYDVDGLGEQDGWGLAAAYDLGGGLSAHLGYGESDRLDGTDDTDTWSFGMAMSF